MLAQAGGVTTGIGLAKAGAVRLQPFFFRS